MSKDIEVLPLFLFRLQGVVVLDRMPSMLAGLESHGEMSACVCVCGEGGGGGGGGHQQHTSFQQLWTSLG